MRNPNLTNSPVTSNHELNGHEGRVARLAEEARRWASFAEGHSKRLPARKVFQKALSAMGFSLRRGYESLAVPSKLKGTSRHQEALSAVHEAEMPFGTLLPAEAESGRLTVYCGRRKLGYVQPKHAWLRSLIEHGAKVCLTRVTGTERRGWTLGCNIHFACVAPAIEALRLRRRRSSSEKVGGGGKPAGNGQAADEEDIRLWRDRRGFARANVDHVERHSPTGFEWGYGGSGPADLAYSILLRFTTEEEAARLYQRFKRKVIAHVPEEGATIPADYVRRWIERQREEG